MDKQEIIETQKSFEEVVERFNSDEESFIKTEALKIFHQAKNDETALGALMILEKMAQPF